MPDMVKNVVRIYGFRKDLEKLMAKVRSTGSEEDRPKYSYYSPGTASAFTLWKIIPVPKEVQKAGYSPAGYEWQSKHWGTKWDVNATLEDRGFCLVYTFKSAWCMPKPVIDKLYRMFPSCYIKVLSWPEFKGAVNADKFVWGDPAMVNRAYDEYRKSSTGSERILAAKADKEARIDNLLVDKLMEEIGT